MQLPFRNSVQRVLQWNAEPNGFDVAQCFSGEIPIDQAPTRSAFLLQLIERKHSLAVVVASHPFGEDLNLLRQFMHQFQNAPLIVLALIDCPYSIVGLEKEFFAVVQVEESVGELSEVLSLALEQGMARQLGTHADDADGETGGKRILSENSIYQELTRAKQMPIVNISGEVGTGKTSLARLLHQMRGGIDRDCLTFYCGQQENSVAASVERLLQHAPAANTFVLRDPSKGELSNIAQMFTAAEARDGRTANQLIIVSDTGHQLESLYPLDLFPLRDRAELIPEIAAGTLTVFAGCFPDIHIEIESAGISFLQNYDWPGNIREFNLTLIGSLLAEMMKTGSQICLTANSLRAALLSGRKSVGFLSKQLGNRLDEICEFYAKCGWGAGQELRELMNQVLLCNARLAWQIRPREQEQVDRTKKAA